MGGAADGGGGLFRRSARLTVGLRSTVGRARASFGPGGKVDSRHMPRLRPMRGERGTRGSTMGRLHRWATGGRSAPMTLGPISLPGRMHREITV